ncbi:E3 SUMO-protein ligase ZBED1-like [Pygocentrus nattereri]|uniref:E3 SUMO-protein ligase ZBED1-like n=1 Tax=Pygocentrus nattereri TaxID=42514 RepID=UPI0018919432|nr:E3 SUMO-protein ligase ZBED1-like [Pygocentrus nattereri]
MRTSHSSVLLEESRPEREPSDSASASTATTSSGAIISTLTASSAATTSAPIPTSQPGSHPPASTTHSSIKQFLQKSLTPARQNAIDEELAKMEARDFQPFSIVEDVGFRSYSHALNPMYVVPSRKTLSQKIIPGLYEAARASLQERVKRASAVCLTTDCWTSRATTSFMSVTCHFIENYSMVSSLLDCFEFSDRHTSENLAEELLRVAREWGVEHKVVCCVTDNAANITRAIQLLKGTHHPCLAHTINLFVRNALRAMKPTVDKVKAIVEFFHRSTAATQKLKSTQRQMSMVELKLKQECVTRWNSTFHMIQRMLKSKDAVIATLSVINAPVVSSQPRGVGGSARGLQCPGALRPGHSGDQRREELPFEMYKSTKGKRLIVRYVTASRMLILCRGLQRVTVEHQSRVTTESVKELVNSLCSSMDKKFHRMEYNTILSETTILDPRFKKVAFNDKQAVDEALQRITTAALRYGQSSHLQGGHGGEEAAAARELEEPQASAVWRFFEERASRDTATRNPTADAILEVRSYLEEPLFQRSADPLSWWETRTLIYPHLSHVMERRLCIVATSVPSERIFSKTGQIITERRNRISPAKLRHLVFLNANL